MNPTSFLAGALLGVTGLLTVTHYSKKKHPEWSICQASDISSMSTRDVIDRLRNYCDEIIDFDAQKNKELILCDGPTNDSPDDNALDRLCNRMDGIAVNVAQKVKIRRLQEYVSESENFYMQHSYLFISANRILREHGEQAENLEKLTLRDHKFSLDDNLSYADWKKKYYGLMRIVNGFITATMDTASKLADKLEALSEPQTTEALPEATAPATA